MNMNIPQLTTSMPISKAACVIFSLVYGNKQICLESNLWESKVIGLGQNTDISTTDLFSLFTLVRTEKNILEDQPIGSELLLNQDNLKSVIMNIRLDDPNEPILDINELMLNPISIYDFNMHILPFNNETKALSYLGALNWSNSTDTIIGTNFILEDYTNNIEGGMVISDYEHILTTDHGKSFIQELETTIIPDFLNIYLESSDKLSKTNY